MNISGARESLPHAVELARTEAVFLEPYGRRAAVLVSPSATEKLLTALEDAGTSLRLMPRWPKRVKHSFRQELDGGWTLRFGPLRAMEIASALAAFVY